MTCRVTVRDENVHEQTNEGAAHRIYPADQLPKPIKIKSESLHKPGEEGFK